MALNDGLWGWGGTVDYIKKLSFEERCLSYKDMC